MKADRVSSTAASLTFILLASSLLLTTCTRPDAPSNCAQDGKLLEAMRVEFSPGTAPPTQDAPGLRDAGNRVPQELPLQQAAPGNCFQNIVTKIRAEEGNDCDTYRVEIAGFSERCVKDCDDKARLEELRQAGQKLCFEFCQRKQCKGPTFSPPPECAISECGNNPKCDQNICPNLNACFLLQTRRVWNCVCQEL